MVREGPIFSILALNQNKIKENPKETKKTEDLENKPLFTV